MDTTTPPNTNTNTNFKGIQTVEGYIKKKKMKRKDLISDKTSYLYFKLCMKQQKFCFKANKEMKEWKTVHDFVDLTKYFPKVDKLEEYICDYHYGFQLYTTDKKYVLFIKDEQEYHAWIRILEYYFHRRDLGPYETWKKNEEKSKNVVLRSNSVNLGRDNNIVEYVGNNSLIINPKYDNDWLGNSSLVFDVNEKNNTVNINLSKSPNREKSSNKNRNENVKTAHFENKDLANDIDFDNILADDSQYMKYSNSKGKNTKDDILSNFIYGSNNGYEEYEHKNDRININLELVRQNKELAKELATDWEIEGILKNYVENANSNTQKVTLGYKKEEAENNNKNSPMHMGIRKVNPDRHKSLNKIVESKNSQVGVNTNNLNIQQAKSKNNIYNFQDMLHIKKDLDQHKFFIENLHCGIDDNTSTTIDQFKNVIIGKVPMKLVNKINMHEEIEEIPLKKSYGAQSKKYLQNHEELQNFEAMKLSKQNGKSVNISRSIIGGESDNSWSLVFNIKQNR